MAHVGGLSTVWVCAEESGAVAGFFTLTNHVISGVDLPEKDSGGLETSPATLIGKLAVRRDLRGQGFGSLLVQHAVECAVQGSDFVASRLIYLDAGNDKLRNWYTEHSFKSLSDVTPLRMYMKMSTARRAVQRLQASVD
jgi:GNAT superfamily N-acetyltransferase